jgi:2-polyprenyl-3-methyl-5-hydroxy-6-metoxy-1,4-benzoquinol methylase
MEKCKICKQNTEIAFKHKLLKKYSGTYLRCKNCGFLFAKSPNWLKDAYKNSITSEDTGLVERNLYYSFITQNLIKQFYKENNYFLDYAGGYGLFSKLMQDKGLNFYWQDNYTKNIFSKNLEYCKKSKKISLITCFEGFEHFQEPIKEIEKMLKISRNILFSTAIIPDDLPDLNWEYYGFSHGQHISFYSLKTLKQLAKKYNLNLYSEKNLHLLTEKKISKFLFNLNINVSKAKIKLIALF